ncbi:MAG TPA: hypothetical protein PKC87_01465, partial [Candidatus Absconditabacterales bacterium]|nr:hypothetical protein [Candidatus Absconditabacterales bacterium]
EKKTNLYILMDEYIIQIYHTNISGYNLVGLLYVLLPIILVHMKRFLLMFILFLSVVPVFSFAQNENRGKYGENPIQILDNVVSEANDEYKIQQTALDSATDKQGAYASTYKIANTLDWLRNNINPYLQWAVYIGLSIAVILLIYNGFLMVTNSIHKEGETAKIKKNIINIAIGVIVLTGFYFIIKLAVSLINSIFGGYGGNTGF